MVRRSKGEWGLRGWHCIGTLLAVMLPAPVCVRFHALEPAVRGASQKISERGVGVHQQPPRR